MIYLMFHLVCAVIVLLWFPRLINKAPVMYGGRMPHWSIEYVTTDK